MPRGQEVRKDIKYIEYIPRVSNYLKNLEQLTKFNIMEFNISASKALTVS